jgi:hypothetical protein
MVYVQGILDRYAYTHVKARLCCTHMHARARPPPHTHTWMHEHIHKALTHALAQTHTEIHNTYCLPHNSGFVNAPQCYITYALPFCRISGTRNGGQSLESKQP